VSSPDIVRRFAPQALVGCAGVCLLAAAAPSFTPSKRISAKDYYSQIKKTTHQMFEKELRPLLDFGPKSPYPGNLARCEGAEGALGVSYYSPIYVATTIALNIEIFNADLDAWKLPRNISQPYFTLMDQLAIESLKDRQPNSEAAIENLHKRRMRQFDRLAIRMANDVDVYAKKRPGMPNIEYAAECGDGEKEVKILTQPPGAIVRYIPLFLYKVCQGLNIDPDNPKTCAGWLTALNVTEDMVGQYQYVATWPKGNPQSGTFKISGKGTVTINRQ
jgi:hypothetical protein